MVRDRGRGMPVKGNFSVLLRLVTIPVATSRTDRTKNSFRRDDRRPITTVRDCKSRLSVNSNAKRSFRTGMV